MKTQPQNNIDNHNNGYYSEAIKLHCTAIMEFVGDGLRQEDIANRIYQNTKMKNPDKHLSSAISKTNPAGKFGAKTRKEILEDIQRIYADDFDEIKKDTKIQLFPSLPIASYFRFKQYFMGGTGDDIDNDAVEAAQLDLFYEKVGYEFAYNRYELTVKASAGYREFVLKGRIRVFGKDTLLLVKDDEDAYAATLLHINPKIQPSSGYYYHGFYLTYTAVGEKMAAPIILERIENRATFACNEVPDDVERRLYGKRIDIRPPEIKNKHL